ncbi:MAG: S1 RNA-binding domain-containing protein [Anaerolineae bacterium]
MVSVMELTIDKSGAGEAFAELLDQYDYQRPKRGQVLEGVVMSATETELLVDVGLKRDAIVPREDLDRLPDEVRTKLVPGSEVTVWVLRPWNFEGDLIVSVNKALQEADWERARALLESGDVVEVTVTGMNRGGLLVSFGRVQGFIPQSHISSMARGMRGDALQKAKAELQGETLPVKVIEVDRSRNRLILSEREAQQAARRSRLEALTPGEVLTGPVVSLVDFGAFVDLGGVDGLIHISNLAHCYVNHPAEVLAVGDEVTVRVIEVDVERGRVGLDRKAMLPDPWDELERQHQVGDLLTGTVTNVVEYGLFVALPGGVEGLVHLSQMSGYGAAPEEIAAAGDELPVRIMEIDTLARRVSLSLDAVTASEMSDWLLRRHAQEVQAEQWEASPADEPEMLLAEELCEVIDEADAETEAAEPAPAP